MNSTSSTRAPLPLTLSGLGFPALNVPSVSLELLPGASTALILPEEELAALEALLCGLPAEVRGTAGIRGLDPGGEGVWNGPLAGRVARTFSPLFGGGCWLENLDVDENMLLAALMRGERHATARARALALARRFGLDLLPEGRRGNTPSGTLTVCQWVRAFLMEEAELFLMIDCLRKAPPEAMKALGQASRERRQRGAAFFWLLPALDPAQAAALGVDTILDPVNLTPAAPHS